MVSIPACHAGDQGSIPCIAVCRVCGATAAREIPVLKVAGSNPVILIGNVAEWLRRLPAKQLGYARAGSSPAVVESLYSVMDIILVYGTNDPGSIPGGD